MLNIKEAVGYFKLSFDFLILLCIYKEYQLSIKYINLKKYSEFKNFINHAKIFEKLSKNT